MYEELLTLLVFTSGTFCFMMPDSNETMAVDTVINQNRILNDSSKPPSRIVKGSTPTVVTMNGQNNYQANEQTFYPDRTTSNCDKCDRCCTSVLKRDDYINTPGIGAHKLHSRKQKWNDARKSCIEEGGYLAIPNSLAEESVLIKWLQAANVDSAWLGIHDLFTEGDWVTLTGESLEKSGYDRWTPAIPGDPDNAGGNQNCAILLSKYGGMDDVACTQMYLYFCEITMC